MELFVEKKKKFRVVESTACRVLRKSQYVIYRPPTTGGTSAGTDKLIYNRDKNCLDFELFLQSLLMSLR